MDFRESIEEATFKNEARSWLIENYPTAEELLGLNELECAKLWQKRKYDAGWACVSWPKEHGGRGGSAIEEVIWAQEEGRHALIRNPFVIGVGMAGPTLMVWASAEQKKRYLPKIASGEEVWCQLFSEPASGSDLAALRTKAVRDGDDWVINGQKVWTSFAHYSDFAILLVRTDSNVPKHAGLTYFIIDMKTPGVEVRPIRQISGDSDFNEVYLENVRLHDSMRLGEVGQGWQVAMTTLMNERVASGESDNESGFDSIFDLAHKVNLDGQPAINDRSVRARLADWYCQEAGLRFASFRSMTALSKGGTPGPENSINKLVATEKSLDIANFALDLLGASSAIHDPKLMGMAREFQKIYLKAPGSRIAGGTDEILLNIIGERVLGLPPDLRADKGLPFSEVPTSHS